MKRIRGFSLIELLVAVAIVSILASIAIPGYRDYVRRGKLAEAYTNLASQRVKMEQFYQDTRTYNNACQTGYGRSEADGHHQLPVHLQHRRSDLHHHGHRSGER